MPTAIDLSRSIDIHTHVVPPQWEDYGERFGVTGWPAIEMHSCCSAAIHVHNKEFRRITDQCFSLTRRIRDMDAERVGRQLLSPIPALFCYWGEAEAAADFASMQNDFIAEAAAVHPERFLAAGTLPMQAPKLAIRELERLASLGFSAVEIGTNINGKYLDEPANVEILEAASALGMAVFVHPWDSPDEDRLRKYYLPHFVCLPAETAICATRLILGGVLDRLPELRVGFAHGGGNFLPLLARIDHGHRVRPEARIATQQPPSSYVSRLFFDSITHDPEMLRFLCARAGSQRIMLGSDYPFDMGIEHPIASLEEASLSESDLRNVLYQSAEAFLGLAPKEGYTDAA